MLNIKKVTSLPTSINSDDTLYLSTSEKKIRLDSAGTSTTFTTSNGSSGDNVSSITYLSDKPIPDKYITPQVDEADVKYIGILDNKYMFSKLDTYSDSLNNLNSTLNIYECPMHIHNPQFSDLEEVASVWCPTLSGRSGYSKITYTNSNAICKIAKGGVACVIYQKKAIYTADSSGDTPKEMQSYYIWQITKNSDGTYTPNAITYDTKSIDYSTSGNYEESLLTWSFSSFTSNTVSYSKWDSLGEISIPTTHVNLFVTDEDYYVMWFDSYCKAFKSGGSLITLNLNIDADGTNVKGNRNYRNALLLSDRFLFYEQDGYVDGSYNDHNARCVVVDLHNISNNTFTYIFDCYYYTNYTWAMATDLDNTVLATDSRVYQGTYVSTPHIFTGPAAQTASGDSSIMYVSGATHFGGHLRASAFQSNLIVDKYNIYVATINNSADTTITDTSVSSLNLYRNGELVSKSVVNGWVGGCRLEADTSDSQIDFRIYVDRGNYCESEYCYTLIKTGQYSDNIFGITSRKYPYGANISNTARNELFNSIMPCVVRNGVVQYYLDPNDFTKKADGTSAAISPSSGDDVMIEFPKMGYKIYNHTSGFDIEITTDDNVPGFSYNAFTRNTSGDCSKLYIGAYQGSLLGSQLKSVSGASVYKAAYDNTATSDVINAAILSDLRSKAKRSDGYDCLSYYPLTLIQCLYILKMRSTFSSALGQGTISIINTGGTETKGMTWGDISDTSQHVKFLGIEDIWGNCSCFIDGVKSTYLCTIKTAFNNFADEGSYLNITDQTTVNREYQTDGYIGSVTGTNNSGFMLYSSAEKASKANFSGYGYFASGDYYGCLTSLASAGRNGIFGVAYAYLSGSITARLMYLKPDES